MVVKSKIGSAANEWLSGIESKAVTHNVTPERSSVIENVDIQQPVSQPASPQSVVKIVKDKSKAGRKKLYDSTKRFSLLLPDDTHERLEVEAAHYRISMNQLILKAIFSELERFEAKHK
mgnify:CR=1 FL=1